MPQPIVVEKKAICAIPNLKSLLREIRNGIEGRPMVSVYTAIGDIPAEMPALFNEAERLLESIDTIVQAVFEMGDREGPTSTMAKTLDEIL